MPGTCTTCRHISCAQINAALAHESLRHIAARYGLSSSGLKRHKDSCLSPALVRAAQRREALSADQIAGKLERLVVRMETLLDKSEAKGDAIASTRAAKELRESLMAVGRLLGLWTDKPQMVIDARQQTLVLADLSTAELRALAALSPARKDGDS